MRVYVYFAVICHSKPNRFRTLTEEHYMIFILFILLTKSKKLNFN